MKKIYVCKLCGKRIEDEIIESSLLVAGMEILNDSQISTKYIHKCKENQLGVVELIGIRQEKTS